MQNTIHTLVTTALERHGIASFTITVENISHQHAGHFNGNGESHFVVTVESENLLKNKPLERHRILNEAVSYLLKNGEVHAISFKVK
ncbi:MAG: BolA/IbaG family iron-sulfur metabolism protein [Proteobacteria bacterium]|jgi:stress-induced morphogen|nr:BolA/IbaG family iron-sulfur metabolism protein [Pseudomonadota bacterium]